MWDIENWQTKSLNLLHNATIKHGIKASCVNTTNYTSIFTRDAVMVGLAAMLYNDDFLIEGLCSSIQNINDLKGPEGQILSNFKIEDNKVSHVSFGTLSPKLDSPSWYLLAIALLNQNGIKNYDLDYVEDTVKLLNALEYNGKGLLYVPQGGDWADEYPYEGYILFDQILRCLALNLLGVQYKRNEWTKKAKQIKEVIQSKYFNYEKGYFNCSYTPTGHNETFDFAANVLMGLIESDDNGLITDNYKRTLDWISSSFLDKNELPVAFYPVIKKGDEKWNAISKFHLYDFKNRPHHFHNGGIWPIWLGWYALILKRCNRQNDLTRLSDLTFELLEKTTSFSFDEYFAGDTKEPSGTKELCFTATGILFLCHSIKNKLPWKFN